MSVKISYIVSSIGIILCALLVGFSLSIKMSLLYAVLITCLFVAIIVALVFLMIKFVEKKSKLEYCALVVYFAIVCTMYCLCINEWYGIFSSRRILYNTAKEDIKNVNLCCDSISSSINEMCSYLKYCILKDSKLNYSTSVEEYVEDRFHNGKLIKKSIKMREENNGEEKIYYYEFNKYTLGITENEIKFLQDSINDEFRNIAKEDGVCFVYRNNGKRFDLNEPNRTVVELYAFNKTCSNINCFLGHLLDPLGFCDTYLRESQIDNNMLFFNKLKIKKPKLKYQNKFKEVTGFSYVGFIITLILQILIISPYICVKAISVKENKKKMSSEEFEIV